MATKQGYAWPEIKQGTHFSSIRTIIETAFYGNNVEILNDLSTAYTKASLSPGAIVLDMYVEKPELTGLPKDAKVILFNDGSVSGRAAKARYILGGIDAMGNEVTSQRFEGIIKEAVYQARHHKMYHSTAYIGLDPKFIVKAHLLLPEGEETLSYSWLYNFQSLNAHYDAMYQASTLYDEGDLFIYSDPTWSHPDYPLGIAFFDPEHNCACILGMRYFGEHKKGTLTLAWAMANRHDFVSCHGGLKSYNYENESFVMAVFGLSGSGKSTLTHATHEDRYNITVLHDDAFILDKAKPIAIALEPAYFDKTQDYPMTNKDNKYLVTVQNNGVTLDDLGHKVLVTDDIRNGNGRALKSKIWSPHRVDIICEQTNALIWLMKDPSLPPVIKIDDPLLAAVMGATLATKRSSAERLAPGEDMNKLVIEPYANPFRTYPLGDDYHSFKTLLSQPNIACYIFNTGHFIEKKVTVEVTLNAIEMLINKTATFEPFGSLPYLSYLPIDGYLPNFDEQAYRTLIIERLNDRLRFIQSLDSYNALPEETIQALTSLIAIYS